jgi:aspartate/methionine/tyrosine aminotransferase
VNGVAKTYAMTGWRVGWMIGAPDVMDAAVNYQSQTTSNISNISQRAAVAALTGDLEAVAFMRSAFDRRRKTMLSMLNNIDGVQCTEPEGAFYCYPNVTGLLGRSFGGRVSTSSTELAEVLLETIKIAVVPGEAFGTPGYFRLSYALGDDDLVEGLERLSAFVAKG